MSRRDFGVEGGSENGELSWADRDGVAEEEEETPRLCAGGVAGVLGGERADGPRRVAGCAVSVDATLASDITCTLSCVYRS